MIIVLPKFATWRTGIGADYSSFRGSLSCPPTHKTLKNEAESRLVGAVQPSPSCDEKGEEIHQEGLNIQKLCEICNFGLWTQHGCIFKDGAVELISHIHVYTNNPDLSSASARSQCTSLLL